jgi:hypothetical protein
LLTELKASFEQVKTIESLVKKKEEHRRNKGLWKKGSSILSYAAGMTKKNKN